MKAWQFHHDSSALEETLKLNETAPLPDGADSLQPDQVLVKVIIASINPVDYKFAEVPWLGRYILGSPYTPGMDFAGRVAATGSGASVADLKQGQLVFGRLDVPSKFGTLAEYTIVARRGCAELPRGVSAVEAACASSVGFTAYSAIVPKIRDGTGKRVFINGGSGGCGTFGIQIAKIIGCHVTTSCSTRNVALCRELGADHVIDYTKSDLIAELKTLGPFDLIVDNVGVPTNLYWETPSFTHPGSPYVQVGALAVTPGFMFERLFKTFWPSWLGGGSRPWEFLQIKNNVADFARIAQWMREKKLRAVVDEVYSADADGPANAYRKLKTGRARGKILVQMDHSSTD